MSEYKHRFTCCKCQHQWEVPLFTKKEDAINYLGKNRVRYLDGDDFYMRHPEFELAEDTANPKEFALLYECPKCAKDMYVHYVFCEKKEL